MATDQSVTGPQVDDVALRIGFACHWTRPMEATWSGTPWQLRRQLRRLTTVVDLGVELPGATRTLLRGLGARRSSAGWTTTWRHGRATRALVESTLNRAGDRERPDVVVQVQDLGVTHAPSMVVQDLSYALLLDQFGPDGVPHFRALGRKRIDALRRGQDRVYEHAAALLPMSNWLAESLVAHGVPENKVKVVHPGANAAVVVGTPVPVRRTTLPHRLLFVGRDFDTKGGALVVAAFRRLRAELGTGIELTIAGPVAWPLRGEVPDGVTFLGAVRRETVGELMDSHDLFLMPSELEGFGIAFVEALSRGLPCIGRDACAMPEIIDSASGGRLLPRGDPDLLAATVIDALEDDVLYAACAAAADARRIHYTWERAAREVLDAARSAVVPARAKDQNR